MRGLSQHPPWKGCLHLYRLNLVPSQCVPYTAEFIICTGYNKLFILLHLGSCVLLFLLSHLTSHLSDSSHVLFGSLKLLRHCILSMLKTVEMLNILVETMILFAQFFFNEYKVQNQCGKYKAHFRWWASNCFLAVNLKLFCIDQPLFS